MKVGVVGLGLIGGSMAGAYKRAGAEVFGSDINKLTQDFAKMAGTIDEPLTDENLKDLDVLFLAITPVKTVEWIVDHADLISKTTLVIDCCGVKRQVCQAAFPIAQAKGFTFIGGHPMAGKQVGGYKNSRPDLFDGAIFAVVLPAYDDIRLMSKVKEILQMAGFTRFSIMTAEEHDEVIAFTSQMAHLVSNAYIKSDMAEIGDGTAVSGGAFRDMTRVAYLDEGMWTELFLENRDNLISELTGFIGELTRYLNALENSDAVALSELLAEGKKRKEEVENAAKRNRK